MPKSTKARKREAVRGVVFFGLIQLACIAGFSTLCFIPGLPFWAAALFGVLAVLCGLPLFPAIAVLKQRFKEIEGGELDAAAQY